MLISEIFHSVQGEGELTGVPSVFVRTSGCNLRCVWCDTPYASWNPEGEEKSIAQIMEKVRKYSARHCVLTGGEPMIARGISELAGTLRAEGYHITIETAGTVPPQGIACDLASISPKLGNSTPSEGLIDPAWIKRHEKTRHQPEVLAQWLADYSYQLKFVVATEPDADEALASLGSNFPDIPHWKILLMPEGIDAATLSSRQAWLVGYCKDKGYRYCDRLHVRLFGNTRGT
jgi:7-carboxy-7-deazaguanine synthase